jgi:H3 lysine-79-specific histone-lysine N-methyltransferase
MERFNTAMQDIQNDGSMAQWLEVRGKEVKAREWAKLVDVVHDQAYGRVVGPYSNELEVSRVYSM